MLHEDIGEELPDPDTRIKEVDVLLVAAVTYREEALMGRKIEYKDAEHEEKKIKERILECLI